MKKPKQLVDLVCDPRINESLPVQFEFEDKEFMVDVLQFLDLDDPSNIDFDNNRIRFALTGECFVLLLELNDGLEIMLEEFGETDFIGVTLPELLKAKWKPYRTKG
jgi:hypothetical protein